MLTHRDNNTFDVEYLQNGDTKYHVKGSDRTVFYIIMLLSGLFFQQFMQVEGHIKIQ